MTSSGKKEMQEKSLTSNDLSKLVAASKAAGWRVLAPRKKGKSALFCEITSAEEWDLSILKTDLPLKELFFPRSETLLEYRLSKKEGHSTKGAALDQRKTLVLGVRPCDAASLDMLDRLFAWDTKDSLYLERRKNTVIVGLSCERADEVCLCTTLGLSPSSEKGNDLLLFPAENGGYAVRVLTEKGGAFVQEQSTCFGPATTAKTPFSGPAVKADISNIRKWLDAHFEDPFWTDFGLRCMGCGACAYACPTCHCFDIIDEGNLKGGKRVRNWDSCGFGLFTLHASGHNPRPTQDRRYRQRIMHKFSYYPDRFQVTSCTGCGRCIRVCPAGLNLAELLKRVEKLNG